MWQINDPASWFESKPVCLISITTANFRKYLLFDISFSSLLVIKVLSLHQKIGNFFLFATLKVSFKEKQPFFCKKQMKRNLSKLTDCVNIMNLKHYITLNKHNFQRPTVKAFLSPVHNASFDIFGAKIGRFFTEISALKID